MIDIYVILFSIVFHKGIFQDSWLISIVRTINTMVGRNNAQNYIPVTSTSLPQKVVYFCLNKRITLFLETTERII